MRTSAAPSVVLLAVTLAGCAAPTHTLVAQRAPEVTSGTFQHEGPSLTLSYRGKLYEARQFPVSKSQDLDALRRRYGSGTYFNGIFSGLNRNHYVYSAQPELRSADGDSMQCKLGWRANRTPVGTCITSDQSRIDLAFK
ncbi:MAG TPA: hypothetical protein VFB54_08450 [Burkholderiales bacterium]|nr:hypothetical protein [Burkholderiales bacterium]